MNKVEKCVDTTTKSSLHYKQREFFKPINAHWEYKQEKVFENAPTEHNLFIKAVPVYEDKEIHLFGSNTIEGFWKYYNDLSSCEGTVTSTDGSVIRIFLLMSSSKTPSHDLPK